MSANSSPITMCGPNARVSNSVSDRAYRLFGLAEASLVRPARLLGDQADRQESIHLALHGSEGNAQLLGKLGNAVLSPWVQQKHRQQFGLVLGSQDRHESWRLSAHRWKISPI